MESDEDNFLVLSRCKDLMSFIGIHHSEIKAILKTLGISLKWTS